MSRKLPNPITKEFLESEVVNIQYTHITGTLTHCAVTVAGGFIFTGESACADPANYDQAVGEKYALEDAMSKMWLPYGFLLKEQLIDSNYEDAPYGTLDGDICLGGRSRFEEVTDMGTDCPIKKGDLFDFGSATYLLEQGERVMRAGWNGKNMWLILIEADQYELKAWKYFNATEQLPFIAMKTADNKIVPWLASQTDMLCKDWTLA